MDRDAHPVERGRSELRREEAGKLLEEVLAAGDPRGEDDGRDAEQPAHNDLHHLERRLLALAAPAAEHELRRIRKEAAAGAGRGVTAVRRVS